MKKEKKERKKEYEPPIKRGALITFLKGFLSFFRKKVVVETLSDEPLGEKAIYLSNHAGANGPMTYEIYFPKRLTCWGAHEMCEGIKSRWNYLYHVFYRQKLHWGKFKSFIVATVFCPFSRLLYSGVGLIPTYHDTRFLTSLKMSRRALDENSSILIFPENSEEGYKNPPDSFHNGFMALHKVYKRHSGENLPVYVCYFGAKQHRIVVSKPIDVEELFRNGLTEDEIVNLMLQTMQTLYREHIAKV